MSRARTRAAYASGIPAGRGGRGGGNRVRARGALRGRAGGADGRPPSGSRADRARCPAAGDLRRRVTFHFQASLHHLALRAGRVRRPGDRGRPRLGQVTDLAAAVSTSGPGRAAPAGTAVAVRLARGRGIVLDGDGRPFHDAAVRRPDRTRWAPGERAPARGAGLTVGELLLAPGVPATLDSAGLGRHTFLCGQSGSGKTYSLGLLLERVLAETSLRVVVLDPNSDYVGLARVRAGADPRAGRALRAGARPRSPSGATTPTADHPLRLRFARSRPRRPGGGPRPRPGRGTARSTPCSSDLLRTPAATAGRWSPAPDAAPGGRDPGGARARPSGAEPRGPGLAALGPATVPSLVDEMRHPTSRCTVVDLGSLDTAAGAASRRRGGALDAVGDHGCRGALPWS